MWTCKPIIALSMLAAASGAVAAEESAQPEGYVFAWPFVEAAKMEPRGGTTQGPQVELLEQTREAFQRLHEPGLSEMERDRRAILAMAGSYRVSFDFLEIIGYAPGFEPAQPYRSWATEYIFAIENGGEDDAGKRRISLQHVLVMEFVEDGERQGPFVTKHWRQDWTWQAKSAHTYRGLNRWARATRDEDRREGRWLQQVWQVDDSPRYAGWGRWEHTPERSRWISDETWRPLPRREFSVRDDYDALVGINRHIILPTGWVHEQHNVKAVLDGTDRIEQRLAREIGIVRYERITDLDTEAASDYWQSTQAFWAEVRAYWDRAMTESEAIGLKSTVDGQKLFEPLFARASAIAGGESFSEEQNRRFVADTIDAFRSDRPGDGGEY